MTRRLVTRVLALSLLVATAIPILSGDSAAAENVVVGQALPANQQISFDQIDHSGWDRLLKKYVNGRGQVNYWAWHESAADGRALDDYLRVLSTASRTKPASRQSQIAFWINAYNAVTIKGILREYPTSSIRNHTAKVLGYNIWKDLLLIVGNTKTSLDDMEHKLLRKMEEPRIHFAIVCASHSCPRLLNEAYTSANLERQLVANTQVFFANQDNFRYDVAKRQFYLSSILKWFAADFGADQSAQLKAIAPYLPTKAAQVAAIENSVSLSYLKYDWGLNEQSTPRSAGR